MIKIQQLINGETKYEASIKSYNYDVPTFLANGAVKVTIEYPTSTIVITPETIEGEVIDK